MKIRTAFILGAGLGKRLRPLTEHLPKPLLPLGGRPLITYAMDHCLSIGVSRFIVNTHHCAGAYDRVFPDGAWRGAPILFRHEPVLLDTAGGLKNIEDLLEGQERLLVYNGDILSDLPLAALLAAHGAGGREVTLALRSQGPLRNVCLGADGTVCDLRDLLGRPGVRRCLFTGIYVVEKRFLARLVPGKIESVVPVFARMIRRSPGSVGASVIDDGTWEDVGDVAAYSRIAAAVPALRYPGPGIADGGCAPPVGLPGVGSSGEAPAGRGGCIAATAAGRDASGNPVPDPDRETEPAGAGDGSGRPPAGADPQGSSAREPGQEGAVAHGELAAFVRQSLGLPASEPLALLPVGKGGSDRSYFRVSPPNRSAVIVMRYGRLYAENDGYAAVAAFLREIGVSVPAIHGHDPPRRLIVLEDLGDTDLYALRDAPWELRRGLYQKTLVQAAKLHAHPPDRLPSGLHLMAGFDTALYRWERGYFFEECVRNLCRIAPGAGEAAALEAELALLAGRLLEGPLSLVHRDLQSQNVMVRAGEPVLIDFQGLRAGSPLYDLGSLLWDPYVSFPEGAREELLHFYHGIAGGRGEWEAFRELFLLASAQRLMQALGAYGFLGLKRGKPHFLAHVRPALANLIAVTAEAGSLPRLNGLARRCLGAMTGSFPGRTAAADGK